MRTVPALTDRSPAERWREVRDEEALWGDLRPELLQAVKRILEATMEDELAAHWSPAATNARPGAAALSAVTRPDTPWTRPPRSSAVSPSIVSRSVTVIDP
jgi:hypothetical protein